MHSASDHLCCKHMSVPCFLGMHLSVRQSPFVGTSERLGRCRASGLQHASPWWWVSFPVSLQCFSVSKALTGTRRQHGSALEHVTVGKSPSLSSKKILPSWLGYRKTVLVCLGCHNKIPQTGWLTQQRFTFSQFWSLEVQDKCWQVFSKPLVLVCLRMAAFCVLTWSFLGAHTSGV